MDERELARVRSQLEEFAAEVFAGLARSDQRATGQRYLRGLMLDGARKSMQPMGERLGVDYQQLQQFITSSTWDAVGVRRRVAAKLLELVDPVVWVIDDTGFAKDGMASPCVARQYSGTLGKVANCQIAVSVHAATDTASGVLDWRLFVPESWDETCVADEHGDVSDVANPYAKRLRDRDTTLDEAGQKKPQTRKKLTGAQQVADIARRRAAAKIPDEQRYRPKWVLALEMIDEVIGWGHQPPVATADAGYGQVAEFRDGLTERDIRYVVATTSTTTAHPADTAPTTTPYRGRGAPSRPRYRDKALSLKELALGQGQQTAAAVRWRTRTNRVNPTGDPTGMTGHFLALRVRPAGRHVQRHDGVLPERWLLVEWPPGKDEPSDYWLSDLPAHTPLADLVRLAKSRWRIEHDYRELKNALGLDHYEGRTWTGWHRHVTLVTAAQLFLTQLRLTNPKAPGQT